MSIVKNNVITVLGPVLVGSKAILALNNFKISKDIKSDGLGTITSISDSDIKQMLLDTVLVKLTKKIGAKNVS